MGRSCRRSADPASNRAPSAARAWRSAAVGDARPTRSSATALAIGVATGAYAVSFGVLAVGGRAVASRRRARCRCSSFTGASQFAVVGVLGAGGSVAAALAPALLLAARNGDLRPRAGAGPARRPLRRAARGAARDRRVDGDGAAPRRDRRDARRAFLATGLSVFAVLEPRHARRRAARRRPRRPARRSASTRCSRRRSWRCCAAAAPARGAGRRRSAGASIALAALPVAPAGVPVLAAVLGVVPALARLRARPEPRELGGDRSRSRVAPTRSRRLGPLVAGDRAVPPRVDARPRRCSPSRCSPRSCSSRRSTRPAG